MSRIGKQTINIPTGVEVRKEGDNILVKGPKGSLSRRFLDLINIEIKSNEITLKPSRENNFTKALWGTYASHIKNMIQGAKEPFIKKLILEGVGFKSEVSGKSLNLALGFSHPVRVDIPEGLSVSAEKNNITVSGSDKELVGRFAAEVRSLKKPEPYKGKGFRYENEVIRRKQGKKTA